MTHALAEGGDEMMTYNFDPERWYDNELAFLTAEYKAGRLSKTAFEKAKADLDRKYDEMIIRLDGSYQIPK